MTPIELRDFWNEVIENNKGIQKRIGGILINDKNGPNIESCTANWKVIQKIKIIDIRCAINSIYDVEWLQGNTWVMCGDGKMHNGLTNPLFTKCRIRENHIHFYSNTGILVNRILLSEELGIPEGLELKIHTKGSYLAGFEVLGCLEGWSYE